MKICKTQIRNIIAESIWIIAIALYTAIVYIKNSLLSADIVISNAQLHKLAVLGVMLLVIVEILEFKFDKSYLLRSIVAGAVLGVLFLILFRWAGTSTVQKYYAQVFFYVFAARNIEWKHTGLVVGLELLLLLLITFFLANDGRIPNFVFVQSFSETRVRQSLGFYYCLQFTAVLLNAIFLILSARENKIHIVTLIIFMAASILVYEITDARIGFTGIGIAIIATLILKYFPEIIEKFRWLFCLLAVSPFLYLILSVIMAEIFDPDVAWMRAVDVKLESRLSLNYKGMANYGVSLFGQSVRWQGAGADSSGYTALDVSSYNWVDNVYIKELIDHGVVYEVIIISLITITMIQCVRERRYLNVLLIAILYGIGLLDDNLRIYCFNSMILMIGVTFMKWRRIRATE